MRITHSFDGFHGCKRIALNVDEARSFYHLGRLYYAVSAAVAKRINNIVCPSPDCTCGEQIAIEVGPNQWAVIANQDKTIKGNYPQYQ